MRHHPVHLRLLISSLVLAATSCDSGEYDVETLEATALVTQFATGFEVGQAEQTWYDSLDLATNVSGYLSGIAPECSWRVNEQNHTTGGSRALVYSGKDDASNRPSYAYFRVFAVNIELEPSSKLTYWIRPDQANGQFVGVDFHFTDNTTLRESAAVDQNGCSLHPAAGHCGRTPAGVWTKVESNVGQWLAGKTIDKIWVAYDQRPSKGQFRGFIDDISIVSEAVTTASCTQTADKLCALSAGVAPTIDGNLSEPSWVLSASATKAVLGAPNNTVSFGTQWNASYLYVGIKVLDAALQGDSPSTWWDDDSIEVYVDADNNNGTTYDSFDRQFTMRWNDAVLRETSGKTTGVLHALTAIPGGYSVELAIPWSNLGITAGAGTLIGLDVGYNDDDNGGARDGQAMWHGTVDNYQNTSAFGDLELAGSSGSADTTPPVISGVTASTVTTSGATITWTTNEASDSQVEYGTTTNYGSLTALDAQMVTSHGQTLTGLTAGTAYQYRVKSKDAAGNLTVSANSTFTTSPAPPTSGVTRTSMPMGRFGLSQPPWPDRSPAERDFDVAEYQALGVQYLRIDWISDAGWQAVTEQLVNKWRANGFQIVLIPGGTTSYASRPTTAAFETFCRDMAIRFAGKAGVFEVMNEPDINGWTPETYVPYLQACYRGVKAGNPDGIVSTGGLWSFERHIYGDPNKDGMGGWMRRMYQAGAKGYFDAVALHLYEDPADHSGGNSTTGTWWNPWDQAFLNTENVRGVMDANGDQNKPVWSSEDGQGFATEATQATTIARQSQFVKNLTYPIASRTVFTLRSDWLAVGVDSHGFGLLRLDLSRKPAWFAFRDNK